MEEKLDRFESVLKIRKNKVRMHENVSIVQPREWFHKDVVTELDTESLYRWTNLSEFYLKE